MADVDTAKKIVGTGCADSDRRYLGVGIGGDRHRLEYSWYRHAIGIDG
jgi:hypothetical protein